MNLKDIKIPPVHLMLKHFFGRFHVVTFTIIVIGGLSIATYFLNEVVASSAETTTSASVETTIPGFEKSTIERVNNLSESSGQVQSLNFPSGKRTNPFTE